MSRNTMVVAECKNCDRDFWDGTVAERLHSKYCPTCQRAYSKALDDFLNEISESILWGILAKVMLREMNATEGTDEVIDYLGKIVRQLKAGGNIELSEHSESQGD